MGRLRNPIRIRLVGGEGGEERRKPPRPQGSSFIHGAFTRGIPRKANPDSASSSGPRPLLAAPLHHSLVLVGMDRDQRRIYIYIYIRNILVKDSFSSRGGHSSPRHFRVAIRLALAGETLPGGRLACTSTVFVPPVPTS